MGKLAILRIRADHKNQEFLASLQICQDNGSLVSEIEGARLSSAKDIESRYCMWRSLFKGIRLRGYEDWEIDENIVVQRANLEGDEACRKGVRILEANMQDWLKETTDPIWQRIREKLSSELAKHSHDMRLVIKADPKLWKYPWHQWDILNKYPDIGVEFCLETYDSLENKPENLNHKRVKILAVFGDSSNINLLPDREAILSLKAAKTDFLDKPTTEKVIEKIQQNNYDVLFFAGHSITKNERGKIYINETEILEIDQFKETLKQAITRGLKIAIFNSCEGLGLVKDVANLQISAAIFMQEKVPDQVAQCFLKEFLVEYVKGNSLPTSFRRAQINLEKFAKLPGASWLPKLYQNLGEVSPTWESLQNPTVSDYRLLTSRPYRRKLIKFTAIVIISVIVTTFLVAVRSQGFFQPAELSAFDHFMQLRPTEEYDPRLLIVEVKENDFQQYGFPLPDYILAKAINKLEQHNPIVIGLDMFRPATVAPATESSEGMSVNNTLEYHFQSNPNLIGICSFDSSPELETPKPPKLPEERSGFVNFTLDKFSNYKLRRYLLSKGNPISRKESNNYGDCETLLSFSLQLAMPYLQKINHSIEPNGKNWFINRILLRRLLNGSGGYQKIDERGYQILLNYRNSIDIARRVSISNILNDQFPSEAVKGKIVLIGVRSSSSAKDTHYTPYDMKFGVDIHAHVVSQLLDIAERKRPQFRWLPRWGDAVWIWGWSLVAGICTWYWRDLQIRQWVGLSIAFVLLYGVTFVLFLQGLWLPLVPAILALLMTKSIIILYTAYKTQHTR